MGLKRGTILETAFETYEIGGQLGSGGAGTVYSAADTDGHVYALKVLDRGRASRSMLKRFRNEIHFCAKEVHKNIIRIVDHGLTEASEPFYVMPCYSTSLRKLIQGRIEPANVLPFFGHVLDGVEAAHLLNVCHRDLKPENILFDERGGILVVADFGIARFEEEELITAVETRNDERLANFVYAAPEQRIRGQNISAATDIYALGLMLNELFTGEVPQGTGFHRISEVAQDFSYLDEIVDQMIQQDPSARLATIDRVKHQLIGKGNAFITQQKLSQLKRRVIPESEIDDPFVGDPIRAERAADYRDGRLVFMLSAAPPPNWINTFLALGNYSAIGGAEPDKFSFSGRAAIVPVIIETSAPTVANHFKNYVEQANVAYRERLVRAQQEKQAEEREALRRQIEEEERRARVLKSIHI